MTPFEREHLGELWKNIRLQRHPNGNRWMAESELSPLETRIFSAETFAELLPDYVQWERGQEGANGKCPFNQSQRSGLAMEPHTSSTSTAQTPHTNSDGTAQKKRVVSEKSLQALPKARQLAIQQPYDVMLRWWPIVRWLDFKVGLEELRKSGAFPRPLAREANERFTALLQKYPPKRKRKTDTPSWYRSEAFYHGLVESFFEYKATIQVPIWWLKFELLFEDYIYKHLID
jgi:hypothetical protein